MLSVESANSLFAFFVCKKVFILSFKEDDYEVKLTTKNMTYMAMFAAMQVV